MLVKTTKCIIFYNIVNARSIPNPGALVRLLVRFNSLCCTSVTPGGESLLPIWQCIKLTHHTFWGEMHARLNEPQ